MNCDGPGKQEEYQLSNQAEVDARFLGCTAITGDIFLASNYSGPLSLPGVQTINGHSNAYSQLLTSISFSDLANITDISIYYAKPSALSTIDLPLVAAAEFISIQSELPLDLSLPSLVDVDYLQLAGNFSSLHLPKLANVDSRLTIKKGEQKDSILTQNGHHLAVDLPSLVNASALELTGNTSSISLPQLTLAFDYLIFGCNLPVNITLPSLTNITCYAAFVGNFEHLDLPNLEAVDGKIEFFAGNFQHPNLETVGSLKAQGAIDSLYIPQMGHVPRSFRITSDTKLNCTPYQEMWNRVNTTASTIRMVSHDFSNSTLFERTGGSGGRHNGLSLAAKMGIGIGVGVPVLWALGLCLFFIHSRNRKRRQAQAVQEPVMRRADGVEMSGLGLQAVRESREGLVPMAGAIG